MQQAYVEMPLTIVSHTKAAHVLPYAICKAALRPLMAGLSLHGIITHILSLIISY